MKKIIFTAIALASFASAACNKIEKTAEPKEITDIKFSVEEPDTKALKTDWAAGDEIMVFFEGKLEEGQQAILRYDGSAWQVAQKPNVSYASGNEVARYCALHYPGEIVYKKVDTDSKKLNYRAGVVLWAKAANQFFDVGEGGIIDLKTITLKKIGGPAFQVVVPGISVDDNYTLSVTCNGKYISAQNNYGRYDNSYCVTLYPYPNEYAELTFVERIALNIYGVSNPDGVEFFCSFYSNPSEAGEAGNQYKYVFALSDGTQLYYYTIPKASAKTIANKSAIKLPVFDGKGAQVNWKTTLE